MAGHNAGDLAAEAAKNEERRLERLSAYIEPKEVDAEGDYRHAARRPVVMDSERYRLVIQ